MSVTETATEPNVQTATETMATQTPTTPAPVAPEEPRITITEWTWFDSESGDYIYVQGIIRNLSDRPMSFVEISIIMRDRSKRFLGTDKGFIDVDVLLPGQSSTWEIMASKPMGIDIVEISNIQWRWAD